MEAEVVKILKCGSKSSTNVKIGGSKGSTNVKIGGSRGSKNVKNVEAKVVQIWKQVYKWSILIQ